MVVTGEDLVGQKASTRDMRKMPSRRRKQIDPLELKPATTWSTSSTGSAGSWRRQREVHGAVREYLVLEYGAGKRGAPPDRLYVPADALDQVTRYVGGEQRRWIGSVDRLGSPQGSGAQGGAADRRGADQAVRRPQATRGHAFGADTPWQSELEDAFPFHETPDQSARSRRSSPTCRGGPDGPARVRRRRYGKTEIAVRAAFKAVQDGKQVAVLVPTTLLVSQHYATFAERMSSFP